MHVCNHNVVVQARVLVFVSGHGNETRFDQQIHRNSHFMLLYYFSYRVLRIQTNQVKEVDKEAISVPDLGID